MNYPDFLFDSRDLAYKSPFGCIKIGDTLLLSVKIKTDYAANTILVNVYDSYDKLFSISLNYTSSDGDYSQYSATIPMISIGLYFYDFSFKSYENSFLVGKDYFNNPCLNMQEHMRWQVTIYNRLYPISDAFMGKTMYQIFPDRFNKAGNCSLENKLTPYHIHENLYDIPEFRADFQGKVLNNDFYGGNLKGITEKLPYLKHLGIDIIYLNPIFLAYSNHRYDTSDYKTIDPMLGTEEDFKQLIDSAHELSIKIMIDGVFSHTGSRSVYFDIYNEFGEGAYHYNNSKYYKWYNFSNNPPYYDSWWGIDTLPCLNEMDPSFLDYLLYSDDSVMLKWINFGIDGIRLDVADELPDEFLQCLFYRAKQLNTNFFILGEVWEDASNKQSYSKVRKYFLGNELDSVMNYVFKGNIINLIKNKITPIEFNENILKITENYPHDTLLSLMNMLSTHDTPRILNELILDNIYGMSKDEQATIYFNDNEIEKCYAKLSLAIFLQFTLPGVPCIYYGDEIGMQGCQDPFNRGYFTWDKINNSISNLYKSLSYLRKFVTNLQYGTYLPYFSNGKILSFIRSYENKSLLCIINISNEAQILECPVICQVYSNGTSINNKIISLDPNSCGLYYIDK